MLINSTVRHWLLKKWPDTRFCVCGSVLVKEYLREWAGDYVGWYSCKSCGEAQRIRLIAKETHTEYMRDGKVYEVQKEKG